MEDKAKKARSPQFPFITLEKAVERVRAFEAENKHHSARSANAAKLWGYADKSSGGIQTIAAVIAYGLMEDEGSLSDRRLKVTKTALTILKDARPGAAEEAKRRTALNPKIFTELWSEWGSLRPSDVECLSALQLDKGFTEDAAKRLLTIYDANVSYAGLVESDKILSESEASEDSLSEDRQDKSIVFSSPPVPMNGSLQPMANERVIYAHELTPETSFRLLASGPIEVPLYKAMKAFAEFQLTLLNEKKTESKKEVKAE